MGVIGRHPRQHLLALVEGSLSPAERARIEGHLAGCSACRAEADELRQIDDNLRALPKAVRGLAARPAGSWSAVWARVQGLPMRPLSVTPQLNLALSMAVVVFVLAAALPGRLGVQPAPVTAGAVQTPLVALVTPPAGKAAGAAAEQVSTALAAGRLATGARAIPIPTPAPGLKG